MTSLDRRELALIFAFWTVLATLESVNRMLDPRGFGFRLMSPAGPIALAFIESWLWAACTPFIFRLASRFTLGRAPLLIAIGVVIAIGVYLAVTFVRVEMFPVPAGRRTPVFAPLRDLARFRFLNQFLVFIAILAAGYAREFFLRDRARAREAMALSAQLAEARLDALRMQIHPHFLFNTLHAISALVERDPAGVRRMIARLSELLRHTIDRRGSDEVPLREELDVLGRYIEIMKIRYQGRLEVELKVDDETLDARVPNLVLQPIVENALEHGAGRVSSGGRVEIAATRRGGVLVLTVCDNGPGLAGQESAGVGLANTRARLGQLYGEAASLTLAAGDEAGVVVTIELPFRNGAAS
jgi:two-component system, LytTR family, sensor kinase